MSGFMSSSTALMVCKADSAASLDLDALRQHAFTPEIDADGRRFGWVDLGDPLDTDGFELASVDARFMGFSFRLDTRKASGAVIRLQLAEAVREEIAAGKKVGGKRKKELKEAITARLTARAEFVPSIIDCIWDAKKGRLLVGSASAKAVQPVLELFKTTFGIDAAPITPAGDMPKLFAAILRGEGYPCEGYRADCVRPETTQGGERRGRGCHVPRECRCLRRCGGYSRRVGFGRNLIAYLA